MGILDNPCAIVDRQAFLRVDDVHDTRLVRILATVCLSQPKCRRRVDASGFRRTFGRSLKLRDPSFKRGGCIPWHSLPWGYKLVEGSAFIGSMVGV